MTDSCPGCRSCRRPVYASASDTVDADRLYRECAPSLFRYLLRYGGDAEAAADAVQEAFARLLERPPRDVRARTWLFRVATNLLRQNGRSERRRLHLLREAPERAPLGAPYELPDREVETAERRSRVRTALDALGVRDRMVLLMRAEGFSHREIAEAAGTTTQSVGTILSRALDKLAAELNPDPEDWR